MKHGLRQKCGAKFEPKKKKQVYCSTKCRTYDYRERLAAAKTELKEPLLKKNIQFDSVGVIKKIDPRKKSDPKEGSLAFFNKYGVSTYAEIKK